jgi:hypothetical protein
MMDHVSTSEKRLLSVRNAANYIDRTEKAIRHMYERGVLTPIRIDGRVYIDPREIELLIEKAKREAAQRVDAH